MNDNNYLVYVHCYPHTDWIFEDFDGGTKEEAEHCAAVMNTGDSARHFHYRYYAEKEK